MPPKGRPDTGPISTLRSIAEDPNTAIWFDTASCRCHAPTRRNTVRGDYEGGRWQPRQHLGRRCRLVRSYWFQCRLITTRRETPVVADCCRSWRQLDIDQFRSLLSSSTLCQPHTWPTDIDDMAAVYDDELNRVLDWLIPLRPVFRRRRPTDP